MKSHKQIIFALIVVSLFTFGAMSPQSAKAFGPTVIVNDMTAWILKAQEKAEEAWWKVYANIAADLALRTLSMYANSFAYDVATELATGGAGQTPQFRTLSIKDHLQKAQDEALGTFLGELSEKSFDRLGINLCDPSLETKLSLTLAIIDEQHPPESSDTYGNKCSWTNIEKNWEQFGEDVQNDLVKFSLDSRGGVTSTKNFYKGIFSKEETDFGTYLKLQAELNRRQQAVLLAEDLSASECRGYMDKATTITKQVKTHCVQVLNMTEATWDAAVKASLQRRDMSKDAATNLNLSTILRDAGNMFLDTFTSKLMKRWLKDGMWSLFGGKESTLYKDYREGIINALRGGADIYQPRNQDLFKSFNTIEIQTLESYDYIGNLAICPEQFRAPDNCAMSPGFLQAATSRLTVNEAIEQGVISGSLPFIGPTDVLNNDVDKCYRDGLCYNNLIKLRKYNIIPVGWELAAQRGPVTLQEAIDCFEDPPLSNCRFGISEQYDVDGVAHNPFYHLVDGDWVLKTPQALCDALVYSAVLEAPESSSRQQYCADPKICLREDDNGNCLEGQFSYCTRSENIWRFEGNICEDGDIYSGCLTFENSEIGTESYIEDSLEYCTSDQAGCKRYSQEQDNLGNWILDDIADDDNDLFLNSQSAACTADVAGCSEYIVMAPDTGSNLVGNGDFEGTTYINSHGNEVPRGFTAHRTGGGVPDFSIVPNEGVNGSTAVLARINDGHLCIDDVPLVQDTNYTISVDTKLIDATDPGNEEARIMVAGCRDENGNYGDVYSPDGSMVPINDLDPDLPPDEINLYVDEGSLSDEDYTRITGTFNTGDSVGCQAICIGADYGTAHHYFDNFKMEVVSQPPIRGVYRDYGAGATIYMGAGKVMCTAEEVGCQGYRPTNGDPMIPAVIRQDDLCPSQCVGYATFTEQPDIFDVLEDPAGDPPVHYYNFIADTARSCPDQQVGCEEFTNLDEVAQGGEGLEYYTYLRQCVPADLGSSYFTWEGSDVAGYQIKTWSILESNMSPAPCTNIDPGEDECLDNERPQAVCSRDDMATDPNCREFFTGAGNSYLRYQDRVIFADNNCHDYRRTETGMVYKAIPELSTSCQAANNGCRSYYGNAANNVREVFTDNFEGGSYGPWSEHMGGEVDLSNESLSNNGHSLKVAKEAGSTVIVRQIGNILQNNKEYELSWWMKNDGFLDNFRARLYTEDHDGVRIRTSVDCPSGPLDVDTILMHDCFDTSLYNISPGTWKRYTVSIFVDVLNPALVDMDSLLLYFHMNGNAGDLFIDNITLKEVTESLSLIRNSWTTPPSCDEPYAGYHLGCQSYIDLNGTLFNLKSFDSLCREEAIGCMPVIDTHNSSNPFEQAYNAHCEDAAGDSRPEYYSQTRCEAAGHTWITDYSEIVVPDDNIDYLVPDSSKYCQKESKGCMALGLPDREDDTSFSTVYKINDPDLYENTLCEYEDLGCETWQSSKGNYYFKDPGSRTCTYQENAEIDGNILSGWFRTSSLSEDELVGCSDDDGVFQSPDLEFRGDYCTWPFDNQFDCESNDGLWEDGQCLNVFYYTESRCEANGGQWVDDDWAAICPSTKNMCTSFRDPSDPEGCDPTINDPNIAGYCSNPIHNTEEECASGTCTDAAGNRLDFNSPATCPEIWNPAGLWTPRCTDYYYYADELIDETSCNGIVDKATGCALFYEANNWNGEHSDVVTFYDSERTYNIIANEGRGSSPASCDTSIDPSCDLDANKLIKVSKDRQCAEWLACKSSSAVLDPDSQEYKIICDQLDTCLEYKYNSDSNTTKCKKWATLDEDPRALTYDVYQSRTSGPRGFLQWDDKEYTGYSIPGYVPAANLLVVPFGDEESGMTRLVYNATDNTDFRRNRNYHSSCVDVTALPDSFVSDSYDGRACTAIVNEEQDTEGNTKYFFEGECQAGICWVSPKVGDMPTTTFGIETRGYAITDAPFPAGIVSEGLERDVKYHQANICKDDPSNPDNVNGCEQVYKRATFGLGGDTIYYPDGSNIPPSICTAGRLREACPGGTNAECDTNPGSGDGLCSDLSEVATFRNWPGVCLEYDRGTDLIDDIGTTYFCNQWYPVDKVSGTASLYDNYIRAGYYDPNGQDALFCAITEPFELPEDKIYCGAFSGGNNCRQLIRVPAGARINLEEAGDLDLLRMDFLDEDAFRWYPYTDMFLADVDNEFGMGPCTEDGSDCNASDRNNPNRGYAPVGLDRIERRDRNPDSPYFHKDLDFVGPRNDDGTLNVETHSLEEIQRVFDTTHDAVLDIEVYFYDERINSLANWNKFANVRSLSGYEARWGPECDLAASPGWWRCGLRYDSTNPYSGHANREDSPEGDYHQVYSRASSGEGAGGGVYDCRGGCGWGKSKVCRNVYCNPLSYNFYAKAEYNEEGPMQCTDYVCSDGLPIDRGMECLDPGGPSAYVDARALIIDSDGNGTINMADCSGDPNCEFAYCIENMADFSGHNEVGIQVEDPANPGSYIYEDAYTVANGPLVYCSDYGYLTKQQIEVPLDTGDTCSFTSITEVGNCYQYLFDIQGDISIFDIDEQPADCGLEGDEANNNIYMGGDEDGNVVPFTGPYTYNKVSLKAGVNSDLYDLIFGVTDEDGSVTGEIGGVISEGCLNYLGHTTDAITYYGDGPNAFCQQSTNVTDYTVFSGSFFDRNYATYPNNVSGTDCEGDDADPLNCYQQCNTIVHLDAEGDNSWVRTDIWWRNSQAPDYPRVIVRVTPSGRWESYYYDSTREYNMHGDVHYAYVGDNFEDGVQLEEENFGAAVGLFDGTEIVSTRVPLEAYPTDLSAATFFAYDDGGDAETILRNAERGLSNLFARTYNFVWDRDNQTYVYDSSRSTEGAGNHSNPFAGRDEGPRILKVCSGNICPVDGGTLVEEGITVNDNNDGELQGQGGSLFVNVKFYYHAHPDHMPIMSIDVDWGDGVIGNYSVNPGKYMNNLPDCNPENDLPGLVGRQQGFGGLERACREGYKVFYHDYQYDLDEIGVSHPCGAGGSPFYEDASCFRPTVRVIDRWGYTTEEAFDGWIIIRED